MTVMTPMWHEGKEVSAIRNTMQGQQGQYNARAILAMAPAQWGQRCHSYNGKDACTSTMVMAPLWQGWSLKTSSMPSQQGQQQYFDNGKDAWTAKMPAHWWRKHHCNEGKDPRSTTAKMPAHWWQQRPHCYKGNNVSLMTMLAWLRQRCHRDKGNNPHRNHGKDVCTSMATIQLRATITIATTVKKPAHQ
jgi:hypothetical protein